MPSGPAMHRHASRAGRSVHDLIAPLVKLVAQSQVLRADSLGCWRSGEDLLFLPRFFFQRRKVHKPRIKVGIFAGIHGDEAGSVWMQRLVDTYPSCVWLNPVPEREWDFTESIRMMRQMLGERMYPLTLEGLDAAMRELGR